VALLLSLIAGCALLAGCCRTLATSTYLPNSGPCLPEFTYALPLVYARLTYNPNETKISDRVKISQEAPIADLTQVYSIVSHHSSWADDDVTFETDNQGLLKSVTINSFDQTAEFFSKVAEIISTVANPTAVNTFAPDTTPPSKFVDIVFDPSNAKDVENAKRIVPELDVVPLAPTFEDPRPYTGPVDGIVYRRPLPYKITYSYEEAGASITKSTIVMCPNRGPLAVLPLYAGPFTDTAYTLSFTSGTLTKYGIKRPSEALGFISIPGSMVRAILGFDYNRRQYAIAQLQQQVTFLKAVNDIHDQQAKITVNNNVNSTTPPVEK
jgi:hypothetical protein